MTDGGGEPAQEIGLVCLGVERIRLVASVLNRIAPSRPMNTQPRGGPDAGLPLECLPTGWLSGVRFCDVANAGQHVLTLGQARTPRSSAD